MKAYREYNIPPDSIFIALGWDPTPEDKRKHYRRFYDDELEKVKEVMELETPFD